MMTCRPSRQTPATNSSPWPAMGNSRVFGFLATCALCRRTTQLTCRRGLSELEPWKSLHAPPGQVQRLVRPRLSHTGDPPALRTLLIAPREPRVNRRPRVLVLLPAERPSSAAAGATEPTTRAEPACPRRRLQRLVRPRLPHTDGPRSAPCSSLRASRVSSAGRALCSALLPAERHSSAAAGAARAMNFGKPTCPRRRLQRLVRRLRPSVPRPSQPPEVPHPLPPAERGHDVEKP